MANLRPLAPFEKRLCVELGCTEEEYGLFLDEMHSQMARKPIPADAIRCDPLTVSIVNAVVGLIFQVVGLLLRPQPPNTRTSRGPLGEAGSPVYGFSSVQELARIGEAIPQVYCDRTANPSGGVRVNGKLVWSQVESRGNYQEGKFLCVLGYGELGAIEPIATAVGQSPLNILNSTASWVYYTPKNPATAGIQLFNSSYLQTNPQNQASDPSGFRSYGVPRWSSFGVPTRTPGTCQAYTPTSSSSFGITSAIPVENTILTLTDNSDGTQTTGRRVVGIRFDETTRNRIANQGTVSLAATFNLIIDQNNLKDRKAGAGAIQQERTKALEGVAAGTRYLLGNTVWRVDPLVPNTTSPTTEVGNLELGPVTLTYKLTETIGRDTYRGRLSSETALYRGGDGELPNQTGYRNRDNRTLSPVYRFLCAFEMATYVTLSRVDAVEFAIKATVWGELSTQYRKEIRYNGNRNRVSAFRIRFRRAGDTPWTDVKPVFYVDRSSKTPTFFYLRMEFGSTTTPASGTSEKWEVQFYPVVDMGLQIATDGMFRINVNSGVVQIDTDNTNVKCYANGVLYTSNPLSTISADNIDDLEDQKLRYQAALELCKKWNGKKRSINVQGRPFDEYNDILIYTTITISNEEVDIVDYKASITELDKQIKALTDQITAATNTLTEAQAGFFQNANWRKMTPFRGEQDARYSFESGPEFSIVAVNEIQYDSNQQSYYKDCAMLGLNIFGGSARQDISQISAFVNQGRKIRRYDLNPNGGWQFSDGRSSNRFGDIFVDTLTSTDSGLGQYITTDMVDLEAVAASNRFTDANGYYFEGVIDQETGWRQWATETAGHSLLQVVTLNGKFALVPVVPFNRTTGAIQPDAYTIKSLFNESNILEGSYSESVQAAEDTLPQIVTVRYRENQWNTTSSVSSARDAGFPRERSSSLKLIGEGTSTDKEVVVNCAGDVTTEAQARALATYLLCARRYEDRSITFKTPEPWLGLAPNDVIRVDTQFTRFSSTFAGRIKADGTYDIYGFTAMPASATVLVYTPGAGTGVQSFSGASFNPASYPNSLVAIGTVTRESRLFAITKIDIDEDGVAEIGAKLFPVIDYNGKRESLIARALLNPELYVEQINTGG